MKLTPVDWETLLYTVRLKDEHTSNCAKTSCRILMKLTPGHAFISLRECKLLKGKPVKAFF